MKDLESLNSDLLADIVSRLDGLSLSSIASTSSQLRPVALCDKLWKNLCNNAWPSTALYPIFPSFQRLFADSYPKLFYNEADDFTCKGNPPTSPCDFVSFVDVFYKNQCVFSTAVRGIPEVSEASASKNISAQLAKFISSERWKWFLSCPFKLNILHLTHDDNEAEEDEILGDNERNDQLSAHLRKDPMEDLNLSWILQWREISLSIEDLKGVLVDGKTSLTILNKALYCSRTRGTLQLEPGQVEPSIGP